MDGQGTISIVNSFHSVRLTGIRLAVEVAKRSANLFSSQGNGVRLNALKDLIRPHTLYLYFKRFVNLHWN